VAAASASSKNALVLELPARSQARRDYEGRREGGIAARYQRRG
jgi:hypothetical protein